MKNLIKSLFILVVLLAVASPVATYAYGGGGGVGFFISGPSFQKSIGDATNDNRVDINDLNILFTEWGQTGSNLSADFNSDGVVDILDWNILMMNWNG